MNGWEMLNGTPSVSFAIEKTEGSDIAFWDEEADVLTRSVPQTEPTHSIMGTLKYSSRPSGLAAPWMPGDSYLQNTLSCIS